MWTEYEAHTNVDEAAPRGGSAGAVAVSGVRTMRGFAAAARPFSVASAFGVGARVGSGEPASARKEERSPSRCGDGDEGSDHRSRAYAGGWGTLGDDTHLGPGASALWRVARGFGRA